MADVAIPPSRCATCGYYMDAATAVIGKGNPGVGDASVCLNCSAVNVFQADLTMRPATKEEQDAFGLELVRVQLEIRRAPSYRKLLPRQQERNR